MFYWSHKDIHVVLSDREEMALVRKLSKGPVESLKYDTSRAVRRSVEQRIFRYLEQSLHADPEVFYRRYVFRSCHGKEAQRMFPVLLDAYGRITRRATIESYGKIPHLDVGVEDVCPAATDDVFQILLLDRGGWPWARPAVSGHVSLLVSSVEEVTGTVDDFLVASAWGTIKFHRDFVRISILDPSEAQHNRADADGG